ncbi:MAG: MBL fold metallo-hydrolase [Archaeoglobaceae archaeon]
MKVTFLGTGVSVPCEGRAQSSILIESDAKVLVDCGIGTFLRLEQLQISPSEIDAIIITHHHLDHNGDLLNILKARWLMGAKQIEIYGPNGTRFFMEAMLNAYPYLRGKLKFKVREEKAFRVEDLQINAIPTIHSIESQGYVINEVAISGDTKAFKDFISIDCSVMIHELSLPFNFNADFHTTPENLKECLDFMKAEKLYLTHLYPMTHAVKERILEFLEVKANIARDLESFELK